MDLKQTGRSLLRVSERSSSTAGAIPVLVDGDYLRPESIRLRNGCSRQATRAVAIVRVLINTNKLRPTGPAEYETWFWIHAVVPATQAQLSAISDNDRPRRRGQREDPRRTPGSGGVGGFILGLQMHGMSYEDILQLVHHAPRDWEPRPPLTDGMLDREGWLRADDDDDGDSDAARQRLRQVLTKLAEREAKAQGVARPRGGPPKKIPGVASPSSCSSTVLQN
jgi:hypothetical protein